MGEQLLSKLHLINLYIILNDKIHPDYKIMFKRNRNKLVAYKKCVTFHCQYPHVEKKKKKKNKM